MRQFFKSISREWLQVDDESMNSLEILVGSCLILIGYLPLLSSWGIFFYKIWYESAPYSSAEYFLGNGLFILFTSVVCLVFGAFVQAELDYSFFPKFQKVAKLMTLPFYLIFQTFFIIAGGLIFAFGQLSVIVITLAYLIILIGLLFAVTRYVFGI